MMPFYNIFNEWYAEQTSKKIKAVWKSKADNGERVSAAVPFGYMKSSDNPKQWIVDEPAAKIVRYIFELCLAGLGPMKIEKAKTRIKELDMLIERIYEDNVLGKISDERFLRMSANYESEQKELLATVESDEQTVKKTEQEKVDLKVFLNTIRKCTDLKELAPTIVNTLIKRIDVHNSVKDDNGVKHVPIDISFTAIGIINVPTEKELITAMEKMREKPLKTA